MEPYYWLSKELSRQKFNDFERAAVHIRQVKAARQNQTPWLIISSPTTGHEKEAKIENRPHTKEPVRRGN